MYFYTNGFFYLFISLSSLEKPYFRHCSSRYFIYHLRSSNNGEKNKFLAKYFYEKMKDFKVWKFYKKNICIPLFDEIFYLSVVYLPWEKTANFSKENSIKKLIIFMLIRQLYLEFSFLLNSLCVFQRWFHTLRNAEKHLEKFRLFGFAFFVYIFWFNVDKVTV